jgi:hypothetical protein
MGDQEGKIYHESCGLLVAISNGSIMPTHSRMDTIEDEDTRECENKLYMSF